MKNPRSQDSPWLIALYISGAGGMLAAYIVVGFFVGRWLMLQLDGPRAWLAVGTVTGLFLGILNIALLIKKFLGGTK
ncbi:MULTISPECIES: AtpZ/AtpI family protein [Paenibacillus]|uniref:ATPase F0F1 n=1 Tax=Paenibacillus campinasensis TaxID=66347 RepID=A0A268EVU6_9BACL|nr:MULTISPECIES: AtpZ/AtpI family protein [Paenibacillus]MUG67526.1 ATPase F0F1 [Paenibacillus campinasensis]PAD77240.1 ATPase F0F1 [Paenibacillus campinasensis]PAK51934.1 ATPase F0F1 [Paenibacillus sp. 7541]